MSRVYRALGLHVCVFTSYLHGRADHIALHIALRELGYTPWHLGEPVENPRRVYHQWTEAMNAKYFDQGKPYDKTDFDRLCGEYDAVLDIPACLFWDDFHTLYPDAKIILTTRSADSWFKSIKNTIVPWVQNPMLNLLQWIEPNQLRPELRMVKTAFKVICNNDYSGPWAKERFLKHNERVQQGVDPDRFLEFQLGDGWDPLCAFLGVPVPDKPYPKVNNTSKFNETAGQWYTEITTGLVKRWLTWGFLPVTVAGLGIYAWKRS